MALEAACGLLEAAWSSGQVAAVEAALLPLQALGGSTSLDRPPSFSSPCQQQVRSAGSGLTRPLATSRTRLTDLQDASRHVQKQIYKS